ncbi:MAG: hypothetical protein M3Q08_14680 [Pseudomonadota bacterium]|nr:hypothetical protein [Pseudomonadota bacterium]
METIIIEIDKSMDEYFDTTDAITRALWAEDGPMLQVLRHFDAYFRSRLWRDPNGLGALAMMLSMNAYMLFLECFQVRWNHLTARKARQTQELDSFPVQSNRERV